MASAIVKFSWCTTWTGYISICLCHHLSWRSTIKCATWLALIRHSMSIFSLLMPTQYVCYTGPFTIFLTPILQSVSSNSLNHLVASAADDSTIIGICGETKLDNEEGSWWTMTQVSLAQLYLGRYLHQLVGLRVLHLPSFIQGIWESVRLSHLSSRKFLALLHSHSW